MNELLHIAASIAESHVRLNGIIPSASGENLAKIKIAEEIIRGRPQIEFCTEHVFHAGMYARTVRIASHVVFTSVLIKRATLLISQGCYEVLAGDRWLRYEGYNVLCGFAGRKQIYRTVTPIELTMIFPTEAQSVVDAEREFTDEVESLLSHKLENDIVVTGVPACRE
jgi:hypothetical protein